MKIQYLRKVIEVDERVRDLRGSFDAGGNVYEPELLSRLYINLKPGDVILDVGACTGSYGLLDVLIDVEIYSFEPVLKSFQVLNENLRLNKSKTTAFNMAVSNYSGKGTLFEVSHENSIALSIVDGKPSETRRDTVQKEIDVITIDKFCQDKNIKPDWIKIDVEGAELRVLEGAKKTIEKYRPGIVTEFCQENANQFGYNIQDIVEYLDGYEIEISKDNLFCICKKDKKD